MSEEAPPNGEMDSSAQSRVKWLYVHMYANIFGICILLQARPMLLAEALGGNKVLLAKRMGQLSAAVGVLELLLNPIGGQLSDRYGRRTLLVISPFINFVNKLAVALNPSFATLLWQRVVDGAVTTLAGSTTLSAALSDMFSGKDLGVAFAKLGSAVGLGAITGSFVSGRLLAANVKATTIFKLSAGIALCQGLVDIFFLKETLSKEKRSKKPLTFPNPFAATEIFTKGSRGLKTLVIVAVLQCMPEGKNISDLLATYQMNDVGLSPVQRANFVTAFGASMTWGASLASYVSSFVGERGFTTAANAMTMLAMAIWGSSRSYASTWLGLLALSTTMERRCFTSAMATDLAVSEGWKKGEYAAAFANVRALTVISAPLIYANIYATFAPRGKAGWAFYSAALIVLAAEMLHRSLPDSECRPKPKKAV